MLRASSLGSILIRTILEPCPWKYQTLLPLFHQQTRATHAECSKPGQIEYGDVGNVHVSSNVQTEQQNSQNIEASGKDVRNENMEQSIPETPANVFVQHMLSLERERREAAGGSDLSVRQKPPYATGKSPYSTPLRPLYGGKLKYGSSYKKPDALSAPMLYPDMDVEVAEDEPKDNAHFFTVTTSTPHNNMSDQDLYYHLCHVISNTDHVEDAWTAYSTILSLPPPKERRRGDPPIPFQHLHRLCRLLSRNRPKTRTQFLRLLSILYTIRKHGGTVHLFEWNSLIANAGSGWRGSKSHDFQLALDVFDDMVSGTNPGLSFSPSDYPPLDQLPQSVQPDIYTYNSLISIAAKTLYGRAIARATAMLQASGHSPDRITHLSLLVYFSHTRQLNGVRTTLLKMRQQKLELGVDGINACIWAFGRHGKLEWVDRIYRTLRHNTHPEPAETIKPIIEALDDEFIDISPYMMPNLITFSTVIQIMAWHGNLTRTYNVLMDMLSSLNMEQGAPLMRDEEGKIQYTTYAAIHTSFRSLFLGFFRHGVYLRNDFTSRLQDRKWTISNLQAIFDTYIALPEPIPPSRRMVYWIMVAFDRTSDHDVELMRQVWMQLEEHFEIPLKYGDRLRVLRDKLFSSEAADYFRKHGFHANKPQSRNPFSYKYSQNS
ncbi:hypothetical protein GYMLUDRAFT_363384 [Collybiopsis luxurians FD-317 M1]|nr:hypothetical protein GYMLUDRAFT_363384 [Collybiopsis luxurians FD-317 M1]